MNIREKLLEIQKELVAPKSQYNSFVNTIIEIARII